MQLNIWGAEPLVEPEQPTLSPAQKKNPVPPKPGTKELLPLNTSILKAMQPKN